MVKWILHVINQWSVKLFKRYEWERFDNDFNIKDWQCKIPFPLHIKKIPMVYIYKNRNNQRCKVLYHGNFYLE